MPGVFLRQRLVAFIAWSGTGHCAFGERRRESSVFGLLSEYSTEKGFVGGVYFDRDPPSRGAKPVASLKCRCFHKMDWLA